MIIEFKYSVVQDLMYHILAHMKVDNPSNLYSEAYIDNVKEIKKGRYDSITDVVSPLSGTSRGFSLWVQVPSSAPKF